MIPNSRIPFIYVDFDNSRAISENSVQPYTVLLIGQKMDTATGASMTPVPISSEKDAANFFGAGSMLHLMAKAYFSNNSSTKTFAIALDDPKDAVAAQWTLSLEGLPVDKNTVPINTVISIFIAGKRVEVVLAKDLSQLKALQAIIDKVKADPSLPVTAQDIKDGDTTVTLICKNRGSVAGSIDVRTEYGSYKQTGPVKLDIIFHPGIGSIDLSTLLSKIGDKQFHLITNPYLDADNLTRMAQDLEERFSPMKQIEGHMIGAQGGDKDLLIKSDPGKSISAHMTILASGQKSPTPDYVWASALMGVIANNVEDPARPFNTLPIYGCVPDDDGNRFERLTRAAILQARFSTYNVDFSGTPRVERLITTYMNPNAPADESFLSLNTPLCLSFLRFSFVNYFASKYPRHKLGDDDAVVAPGSALLTPNTARCEAIALFLAWEEQGLVEGFEQFKSDLYVERNKTDRGRLDFFMSPRLVSQLNVIGAKVSFLI